MIYMDNSATSYPKPACVTEAVKRSLDTCIANPGRSSHKEAVKTSMAVFHTRELVAEFVNTDPERVVFTYNATMALNEAIFGALRDGDRIFTTPFEHNSVLRPLYRLETDGRITTNLLQVHTYDKNVICEAVKKLFESSEKPDAIVMTHTSNVIGARMPIKEIGAFCRENGVLFIVDASQGLGSSRIDMEECAIDILCTSGHKGLYGITGSGFMAISRKCPRDVMPLLYGGSGTRSRDRGMPEFYPERLEAGTLGVVGIESIGAGIEYINSVGCDSIADTSRKRRIRLTEGLSLIPNVRLYAPDADSLSIVLFNIDGKSPEETSTLLDGFGIACRAGFHCAPLAHSFLNTDGAVRLSVSAFNTEEECDLVLTAVERIAKGL